MKFQENIEKIQRENRGYIVLVKCGAFFCGIAKDAIILNKLFSLKVICYKKQICKCGIPVLGIVKYIKKLRKLGYSFVIFNYHPEKSEEILRVTGKMIEEQSKKLNCENCWYREKRK